MTTVSTKPGSERAAKAEDGQCRRGFFVRLTALVLGVGLYVPAAVAGMLAFLNPLREKAQAGRLVRVANLGALPEDGTPQRVTVVAERINAWTHSNEAVGAVFLRRVGDKTVEAIHVVCPHAGCFVEYKASEKVFFCPCHRASFELGGKRKDADSPSPRDLDTLAVEIRNGVEVWVKFENYRTGTPQKIAEA